MTEQRLFTTGDGCKIAYQIDGAEDRPFLTFSNSIATSLHMWDRSVAELGRSFRLLRYDFRGHGGSEAATGPYSMDRLGRDVVELLDHLGIERTHFIGLSLGGVVGQWLAIQVPERIDRLVLSNSSAYLAGDIPFDEQIRTTLAAPDMTEIAEGFLRNWFPADWLAGPNEIVDEFRAGLLATSPHGLAGCYAALRDADFRRTDRLIGAPTLVIGGEADGVTKPEHSREIAETIPGSKLLLLPGIHILNVEQPDRFLSAVTRFLGEAA